MPFMRTSSLDFFVNSDAFNVHHYVNNLTIRQRTPYLPNRALTTLYREISLPSVRTRGQIDALTFFKCIRLTSQLTYESIVNFELEMWIIFVSGSSSLITLNLALTIYKRLTFSTYPKWLAAFNIFFISKHTIAVFQNDVTKCLVVRNFHRISAVKVLPKVLENIRCWFRNVKRFQILIWLFGGQFSSSLLWAYFNIARLLTLKGSFKLPTNIRCLFRYVKQFQKLMWLFSSLTK